MASASVDLPDPLSPTMPTISPRGTDSLMSRSTRAGWPAVLNWTDRLRMSRTGTITAFA